MIELEPGHDAQHRMLALALAELRGDVDAVELLCAEAAPDPETARVHLRVAAQLVGDASTALFDSDRVVAEAALLLLLEQLIDERTRS